MTEVVAYCNELALERVAANDGVLRLMPLRENLCHSRTDTFFVGLCRERPWTTAGESPPSPGMYEVTVNTDDGPEVLILFFNGTNWIYEGEPTYCCAVMMQVMLWRVRAAPGYFDPGVEDD